MLLVLSTAAAIAAVVTCPSTGGDCRGVTPEADTITGSLAADIIRGLRGPDTIAGNRGRDSISGGRGGDTIDSGKGGDILEGKRGDDTITDIVSRDADAVNGGRGDDINVKDNDARDIVSCGKGTDTVTYDDLGTLADTISITCENLRT